MPVTTGHPVTNLRRQARPLSVLFLLDRTITRPNPVERVVLHLSGDQVEAIARRVAALVACRSVASPTWVDAAGAAEHLATTRDRVYDLVQLRKLEPHRDGRRLLFRVADLDAYLDAAA